MLLENDRIVISIPNDQFCTMQKIIESSNEHVLAFAASFCKIADLHLVCMQSQENATGCTFVVFNVSSKTGGANFRTSIVEDGIMVQMKQEVLTNVKEKLMKHENIEIKDEATSYLVGCIPSSGASIEIRWENVRKSDLKIYSSVDGRWLGDSIRFRLSGRNVEVSSKTLLIRLVSLYILPQDEDESSPSCDPTLNDPPDDLYVLIKKISTSLAAALVNKADGYFVKNNQAKNVGVRFAYGFDTVEYSAGIDGCEIPEALLSITDDCLIPILSDSVRTTELPDASVARNRFCAN
uniref:Smad anchor for receptor activation-like C-terminal domain-containing protein n=1 Tax=Romanomermis culicivorax TaxID=13658 RepID=A0A915K4G2_ROMCU